MFSKSGHFRPRNPNTDDSNPKKLNYTSSEVLVSVCSHIAKPTAYGCGRLSVPEVAVLDRFGTIQPGQWYFHLGRSSVQAIASTRASVSIGVAATCNWDGEDRNRFDDSGNLVLISRGVTKEKILLNRKIANGRMIQGEFGI